MQQLLTSARARRGFTMVELLVALVLLGLVSAALYRVLVNNQRLYVAQTQRIDLSQNIRAAANILPAEFRQLDAGDNPGDIISMASDSITIRAPRWTTFVCVAPVLNGVTTTGLTMTVRGMAPGQPMFFGSRAAAVGQDSMYVYLDADQTSRLDDYYVPAKLTAIAAQVPGSCGGAPPQPGTVVTWNGSFFAGNNAAGAITVGAPVWGYERVTYKLFRPAGDTSYYIGYRPDQPAGTTMQPIVGPVLSNGLTFQYFDSTGAPTAIRTRVARIDITVRARSNIAVRSGGTAPARTIVDSIVTSVALRNNRRW